MRLDQIINMRHELARIGAAIDWGWIDAELAGAFAGNMIPISSTS